ncbi:MAG: hypothetical protein HYR84_00910 [Planctomycetes bacterium]|nr:hypothetical protein [Planctomycetota bacterium]
MVTAQWLQRRSRKRARRPPLLQLWLAEQLWLFAHVEAAVFVVAQLWAQLPNNRVRVLQAVAQLDAVEQCDAVVLAHVVVAVQP